MKIEKDSKLYKLVDKMYFSFGFLDTLDPSERKVLIRIHTLRRYRSRHKNSLNRIRGKWIEYNK